MRTIILCSKNNLDFIEIKICNLSIVNKHKITARLPKRAGL